MLHQHTGLALAYILQLLGLGVCSILAQMLQHLSPRHVHLNVFKSQHHWAIAQLGVGFEVFIYNSLIDCPSLLYDREVPASSY